MAAILARREIAPLLSDERFSADGTLAKAWASMKRFQPKAAATPPDDADGDGAPGDPPASRSRDASGHAVPDPARTGTDAMTRPARKDRNAEADFRGEKRSNATHAPASDPDARLHRKPPGAGAMLCFMGHAPMENRTRPDRAGGPDPGRRPCRTVRRHRHDRPPCAGREAPSHPRRGQGIRQRRLCRGLAAEARDAACRPEGPGPATDGRTTRHAGYAASQTCRKKIEEPFGWAKTDGDMAQTMYRGVARARARFTRTRAACNLARLPRLLAA
jgi:hypothetical protein